MDNLQALALIIVLAPLVGAIVTGLAGHLIGRKASHWLTCSMVGLSFLVASYVLYGFINGTFINWDQNIYVWGQSGNLTLNIGFMLDKLSALMICVVTFVSLMVHIYSIGYMHDDSGYQRFFSYISLFTFAMLMLVMANNFMQLFFGWEAVGFVSYLLIGFWFKKPSAIFANLKAFIVNRVGDFGFLLGIAGVLYYCGTLQYSGAFTMAPTLVDQPAVLNFICLGLFIGAMAKSAQIPLHVWLPDSMEGPTPISALIHAATMVTAGVFMVARMSPLFELSEAMLSFITIIGAATCFFMGILGLVQRDIKRIIAYSTLSQLGYMVVALGVSAYSASIFHLVTHAFFKALLFLGAGSAILAMHHEQDIFNMGNLRKYMPITFVTMLVGTLALVGFPGTSGFYSKHLIIQAASDSTLPGARFAYAMVLSGVFVTALYSFRLLFVVFFTRERMSEKVRSHLHESPAVINVPLMILAVPSLIIGAIMIGPILNDFLGTAIYVLPEHNVLTVYLQEHFNGAYSMFLHGFFELPFVLLCAGTLAAWLCYVKYPQIPQYLQQRFNWLYTILINKYGFDYLYQNILTPAIRSLGTICWRVGDVLCIDGIMVNGSARGIGVIAANLKKLQTGYLYHYVFAILIGLLMLLMLLT